MDAGLGDLESDPEAEEGGSGCSGDDSDADAGPGPGPGERKGFLEGGKAETFARAFARIMEGPAAKSGAAGAPILGVSACFGSQTPTLRAHRVAQSSN